MRLSLLLISATALALSCNSSGSEEDAFLRQPPYAPLTDSIRQAPDDAGLHYRRGTLLYGNDQKPWAEKDIRRAWSLDPREEYALSLTTLLKEKGPDSALAFLQEAARKLPGSISLQIGLARGFQQKERPDSALAICNRILAQYPGQIDALLLKAELLKNAGRNAESLAVLETAYQYAPGDAELVHMLAFDYAEAKNPRALALSDSLIRADRAQRHAEPYYFKGVYYANLGQSAEALRQFDEAIRHDFNFLEAYLNKGIVYYDGKKYDEALKTFALAIRVDPTYADAFYWTGKTQEALGNRDDARLNYQRAFGLDKTLTEAKQGADRMK